MGGTTGVWSADAHLAAAFGHTLETSHYNYHGSVMSTAIESFMDVLWRRYLNLQDCNVSLAASLQGPPTLWPPHEAPETVLQDLGAVLYGAPLRGMQREALGHILDGKDTALFSPVSGGKSCAYLAPAYLASRHGQFILLMVPMKSVGISARLAAERAKVSAVVYDDSTRARLIADIMEFDGVRVTRLQFSLLIVSFERFQEDPQLSRLISEARGKSRIAGLCFDEW